jgi:hypothetical protein
VVVSAATAAAIVAGPAADGAMDDDTPVDAPGVLAVVLSMCVGVRLVESAVVADGRRTPRFRKSGGATITIAVSSNARKKRLSID